MTCFIAVRHDDNDFVREDTAQILRDVIRELDDPMKYARVSRMDQASADCYSRTEKRP